MVNRKCVVIVVCYLVLLQGCASRHIEDLAGAHNVFNEPHVINRVYMASCGDNINEYLIVDIEGVYSKTNSSIPFSLLVKKDSLQSNRAILLDNEIVPTSEITNCIKKYDINYKIDVKEYCDRERKSTVIKDLKSNRYQPTNERLTGEFGLCEGHVTGNSYFKYNYVAGDQEKHTRLHLKPSVHSYPGLRVFLPITIVYDIVTFPLQIVTCLMTEGALCPIPLSPVGGR